MFGVPVASTEPIGMQEMFTQCVQEQIQWFQWFLDCYVICIFYQILATYQALFQVLGITVNKTDIPV